MLNRFSPFAIALLSISVASFTTGCGLLDKLKSKSDDSKSTSADNDDDKKKDKDSGKSGTYCMETDKGICQAHPEDDALGLAEGFCKDMKGTFGKGQCPSENKMGSCARDEKIGDLQVKSTTVYYYGGSVAAFPSDAHEDCEGALAFTKGKLTLEPDAEKKAAAKAMPTPDKIKNSCMTAAIGQCEDDVTVFGDPKKQCEALSGKYDTKPCPTQDLAGSCLISGEVKRYYKSAIDLSSAKGACDEMKGHYYDASGKIVAPGAAAAPAPVAANDDSNAPPASGDPSQNGSNNGSTSGGSTPSHASTPAHATTPTKAASPVKATPVKKTTTHR